HDHVGARVRRTVECQSGREVEVRVAMDRAGSQELRVLEPRDHAEYAALLTRAQSRLEPHQVPHLTLPVLTAELHDCVRPPARPRVTQTDRLHRPEAEGVRTA